MDINGKIKNKKIHLINSGFSFIQLKNACLLIKEVRSVKHGLTNIKFTFKYYSIDYLASEHYDYGYRIIVTNRITR